MAGSVGNPTLPLATLRREGKRAVHGSQREIEGAPTAVARQMLLAAIISPTMSEASLASLAADVGTHRASPGTDLITEGTPPAGFFVLVEGRAEVTQSTPAGSMLLTVLGPGEHFGEIAFLTKENVTSATVTALDDVRYVHVPAEEVRAVLEAHPDLAAELLPEADTTLKANLIMRAAAFAGLGADARDRLARAVETIDVPEHRVLMREGETGDACYLIASGEAEVLTAGPDGTPVVQAVIKTGGLVGEGALLTDSPRSATVRMRTPGRVLALPRLEFLAAVAGTGATAQQMADLHRTRWRPRRSDGVETHERTNPDGEVIVVLKDGSRGAYHRLTEDGLFLWDRLDGATSLRDLTMAYLAEYGQFAPERIARIVESLVYHGFAAAPRVKVEFRGERKQGLLGLMLESALAATTWSGTIRNVDGFFAKAYRRFGRWFFTKPAAVVLIGLAVAGLVAVVIGAPRSTDFIDEAGGPILLLALLPANAIGALVHEMAHGLAVKHYGRDVRGAGFAWYFVTPVVFVDTTDMWLESRGRRVVVSAVGPLINLTLGGVAALWAVNVDSLLVEALLWEFVIVSLYLALINLNPMMEYDGYHMLTDLLDRPNLRDDALAWMGSEFLPALKRRGGFKGHGVDLLYGILALLYVVVIALFVVVIYRVLIEAFIAGYVPSLVASGLAWLLAGWVALSLGYSLTKQMRAGRA